eukprot:3182165-Pyramimonas_sp.AAC.1
MPRERVWSAFWCAGALPAAGHGGAVSGVDDSSIQFSRQFAALLAGSKENGGHTAYVLMRPGPLCDPIYDCSLFIVVKIASFAWDGRLELGKAQRA